MKGESFESTSPMFFFAPKPINAGMIEIPRSGERLLLDLDEYSSRFPTINVGMNVCQPKTLVILGI